MRIDAGSFNVDMNAMLNQLNNQNGLARADEIYKKAVANLTPKIKQTNDAINTNIKNVQNVIKTKNEDNQSKISQIQSYEREIHKELGSQINDIRQENQNIINNNIPQSVQNGMAQVRNDFPTNEVCYMPSGQFPSNASPGDICWQSGNFSSNTNINAKAFRYNGYQWLPLKVDTDIYGNNIFGADIHGGSIYGANFVSEDHGVDGRANFSVSPQGDIYARNFAMDLLQNTTGNSLNRITYNTDGNESKGMNFNNGMLNMVASAYQDTGTYINENASNYTGQTYLEPDYLKLRTIGLDGDENNLYGRTDIRGGNLEISNNWGQNTGVRLGYWFDNNGFEGPDIVVGDLNKNSTFSAIGASGMTTTTMNISGTLTVNGRNVTGKQRPPFDPSNLQTQINANDNTLSKHKVRLDGHDYTLKQHKNTLINHSNHLSTHDTQIGNLQDSFSVFNSKYGKIVGGNDGSINIYQDNMWSNTLSSNGDVYFKNPNEIFDNDGWVNVDCHSLIYHGYLDHVSTLSSKKNIDPVDTSNAFTKVLNTDIKQWNYKNESNASQKHIGPIIDNIHNINNAKYYTPEELINNDSGNPAFSLDNAISYLFLSIQQLAKQNSHLTQRVAKLEFEKE